MPIFDQGYQHWSGELGGRPRRWWAITRNGIRSSLKLKTFRGILLLAWLPALIMVIWLCLWGLFERHSTVINSISPMFSFLFPQMTLDPVHYRVEVWTLSYHYFFIFELFFTMLLILLVGPALISADLRFNALPLYFSRPLKRIDYFIGKLGIIFGFTCMVVVIPAIVAWVLGLAFSLDFALIGQTFRILVSSIAYGLVIAISAGFLMLAISSLTRNSRYVSLLWIGLWIVTSVSAGVLDETQRAQRRYEFFRNVQTAQREPYSRRRFQSPEFEHAWEHYQTAELNAAKTDWRPIISYTNDLARIGQQLLGTQESWENVSQLVPENRRANFLNERVPNQFPWEWSAAVLAGLFGVSILILNFRVKSLDRLK